MKRKVCAQDIMSTELLLVEETMSLKQVAHLMLRHQFSGCPVVDKSKNIVGIVTLTDFFIYLDRSSFERNEKKKESLSTILIEIAGDSGERPISQIMNRQVISVSPQSTLSEIVEYIVKWRIHMFPVVEGGKLVGIVGRHDILNALFTYAD